MRRRRGIVGAEAVVKTRTNAPRDVHKTYGEDRRESARKREKIEERAGGGIGGKYIG